jgi:hypothetical protein
MPTQSLRKAAQSLTKFLIQAVDHAVEFPLEVGLLGIVSGHSLGLLPKHVGNCVSAWNKDPVSGVIGIQSGL